MDTVDTAEVVAEKKKSSGRPSKKQSVTKTQDKATPLGEYIAAEAGKARKNAKDTKVIEKWWEIKGFKLSLCKRSQSGTVHRTYIGKTNDKKHGKEIQAYIKKLDGEGKLRKVI